MAYHQTERSEKVRAASRDALLGAARQLFARNGYDHTTMQDIVAAAGTSIGNAYFYFGSKQQLLIALLERDARDIWAGSEAAVVHLPPGAHRVAGILYANFHSMLVSHRDIVPLLLSSAHGAASLQFVEDLSVDRWTHVLGENFPDLPAAQRRLAGAMIWGANRTLVARTLAGKTDLSAHGAAAFAIRWALKGLGVAPDVIAAALRAAVRSAKRKPAAKE